MHEHTVLLEYNMYKYIFILQQVYQDMNASKYKAYFLLLYVDLDIDLTCILALT